MNLQEIGNTYSAELANKIKNKIESAKKIGIDHKIEVIDSEFDDIHTIALATRSYVYIFDVLTDTGGILSERKVGYTDCEKALSLMDKLEDRFPQP